MFNTFIHYFGLYVFFGLIISLMWLPALIEAFKDDDKEEVNHNLSGMFIGTAIWPIVIPAIIYIVIAEKFYKKFERRINNQFNSKSKLIILLNRFGVMNRDFSHSTLRQLSDSRHEILRKRKDKLGI